MQIVIDLTVIKPLPPHVHVSLDGHVDMASELNTVMPEVRFLGLCPYIDYRPAQLPALSAKLKKCVKEHFAEIEQRHMLEAIK